MPVLPQELIDEIIDHLANCSDHLRTCSLVSRAWVPRCRSHLFKTCRLYSHSVVGFRDILSVPGCTFLRDICEIDVCKSSCDEVTSGYLDEIAPVLASLTSIRALRMTFGHSLRRAFFCNGFSTGFPNVTRLTLSFQGHYDGEPGAPLIDLIRLFPVLQELYISRFDGIVSDPSPQAVPPPGLRRLELQDDALRPILMWVSVSKHPKVDSLTLSNLCGNAAVVRAATAQMRDLRHLDIDLTWSMESGGNHTPILDFLPHSSVRTLIVRDTSHDLEHANVHEMMLLITKLSSPTLESLTMDLNLLLYMNMDWGALDTAWPKRFPRLQNVLVECGRHDGHSDHGQFLYEALPLLAASRMLSIKYTATPIVYW
ncbi:hypothetical protein MSAN_00201600 [Mycena sanguinolenta]|uniref:F-box domain-containing protein n=1 Tax=Mycena sanguinolenta TaxID=230812 RepID=A0A8H6ZF02_9AGAR|nr:hypothetical protein MSAN_00201600 [Mycena sanguinolenta]